MARHFRRVIVCGRVIEADVLERIRSCAQGLSRRELARQLCVWQDWKGPGGEYQVSVAVGVLRRLCGQGVLCLPNPHPPLALERRTGASALAEVGAQSAPRPEPAARSLEEIGPVELVVVSSRFSRNYRVWRQLLDQHHYLGSGPLAGHQLRYLIQGRQGWLGALAFSAAALRVQSRDRWIGWSPEVHRENLPYVINNSRFLILPSVRVPNLASHVLGQALGRVSQDWLERFGYRPLLAETFVEQGRFDGGCYRAANWKCIGLTQGRGRQDRDRRASLPRKSVWVYPLEQGCRQKLRAMPALRRLAPLAAPALEVPALPADWAEEEFGGCSLGDQRLRRRLMVISRDFFARPTMNIPQACGQRAKTKAVYRFFDHPRVTMESVLQSHYAATARRGREEKVILAVQDTTDLNYSAHPKTELLGPICDKQGVIGMLVHDSMAYTPQGTPLGLIDVQCWTREPEQTPKRHQRYELEIEQKESSKWLMGWRAAQRLQEQCPESLVVSVGDREADLYELFVQAQQRPAGAKVLVRASQERVMASESQHESHGVWELLASLAPAGQILLELARTPKRAARTALLEIRYAQVELKAPKRKPQLGPLRLWAVTAVERDAPAGIQPLEWRLLTTVEVPSLEKALEVVRWYTVRFQIEVYHRTLKSGCKIEDRQLGNADRIEGCLAVDMVVAWRIVRLTKLGREVPEVPCTVFFEEAQWRALVTYVTKDARPPKQRPTLREAIRMMAIGLGGFLGRNSDGEPGTETIWRGLQRLDDITEIWVVMSQSQPWISPTYRELDSS